jgi:hypothetical protein
LLERQLTRPGTLLPFVKHLSVLIDDECLQVASPRHDSLTFPGLSDESPDLLVSRYLELPFLGPLLLPAVESLVLFLFLEVVAVLVVEKLGDALVVECAKGVFVLFVEGLLLVDHFDGRFDLLLYLFDLLGVVEDSTFSGEGGLVDLDELVPVDLRGEERSWVAFCRPGESRGRSPERRNFFLKSFVHFKFE